MGLLKALFGRGGGSASGSPAPSIQHSQVNSALRSSRGSPHSPGSHKDIIAAALRDTLARTGIPAGWISAETLAAKSRTGVVGVHLRIVVRHWDPRLMLRLVPLQNALLVRVHRIDPVAEQWLLGITWQLSLPDESVCPPLPHPGSWTALADAQQAQPASAQADAGVIEGPVNVSAEADDPRADLERLMAAMDETFRERAEGSAYDATKPMDLKTEPMPLRRDS